LIPPSHQEDIEDEEEYKGSPADSKEIAFGKDYGLKIGNMNRPGKFGFEGDVEY
jgi:hypothetical protein